MTIPINKTGTRRVADRTAQMMENDDLPASAPDMTGSSAEQMRREANAGHEPVGSCCGGEDGGNVGGRLVCLLDKLGARLAYERGGVRLYEAILRKVEAEGEVEAPGYQDEFMDELLKIHDEEVEHMELLQQAVLIIDGDPTMETPGADVEGVLSSGLVQVVNDPRTSVAQCLQAALLAELADQEAWYGLIAQADGFLPDEMLSRLHEAEAEEQEHLTTVRRLLMQAEAAVEDAMDARSSQTDE